MSAKRWDHMKWYPAMADVNRLYNVKSNTRNRVQKQAKSRSGRERILVYFIYGGDTTPWDMFNTQLGKQP